MSNDQVTPPPYDGPGRKGNQEVSSVDHRLAQAAAGL